jgi:Putative Flp pilus-assembly TadE/G-like
VLNALTAELAHSEKGGVVVLVALLMLPIMLLIGLSVQVGDWFVHKRHLQLQVDAAALAAGQYFADCLRSSPASVESSMESIASQYGGTVYNRQVGGASGTGTVTLWYQHNAYPPPSKERADTDVPDGQAACTSAMFDVKATEAAIPHIFNLGPLQVNVSTHARVQLRLLTEMKGLLPVAVPDTRFDFAYATFFNEATGAVIAGPVTMAKSGTSATGQQLWVTPAPPAVPVNARDIGVRIRLVAGRDPNLDCDQLFVECYTDPAVTSEGLVHIRGWSATGGATAPIELHNVWLLPGSCSPDSYFTLTDCSGGVQAEVDFGDRPITGAGTTATVTATSDGTTVDLTRGPLVGGTTYTWTAMGGLPIAGPGSHPVTMRYTWAQTTGTWRGNTCTTRGSNPCKDSGSFEGGAAVQRPFRGSPDTSGPLQQVNIFESGISTSGANSFERGTTHNLGVAIATTGTLRTQADATAPIIYLRVTGSQNQSIDCDPDLANVADELAQGCSPTYEINSDLTCPGYNDLWNTPQPWDCVKTQTGGAVGQVARGMKDRILGGASTCTAPINWPNYPLDDPRIVPLLVTPFGTFSGNGNAIVPVIDFGAFYVMGWDGDPCPGSVSVPKGYIAGHFIKYIPRNPRGAGDTTCYLSDPTQLTPCAAVLTR